MSVVTRLLDRLALPALLVAAGLSMTDRPVFCVGALLERASRVVAPRSAAVVVVAAAPTRVAPAHRRIVVVRHGRATAGPQLVARTVRCAPPCPERPTAALRS